MCARSAWSMYDNLTCPYEWSKYSCVWRHCRPRKRATSSPAITLCKSAPRSAPIASRTVLWLVGDSLMRQIFIAIACAAGARAIARRHRGWSKYWSAERAAGTGSRCISKGPHSGFDIGSVFWRSGFEMHFLPLGGTPHHSSRASSTDFRGQRDARSARRWWAAPTRRRIGARAVAATSSFSTAASTSPRRRVCSNASLSCSPCLARDGPRLLYLTTPRSTSTERKAVSTRRTLAGGCVSDVPSTRACRPERAIQRAGEREPRRPRGDRSAPRQPATARLHARASPTRSPRGSSRRPQVPMNPPNGGLHAGLIVPEGGACN